MLRLRRALPSLTRAVASAAALSAAVAGAVGCDTAKSPTPTTAAPPPTGLPPLEGGKAPAAAPGDRPQHAAGGALPSGHPPVGGQGAAMGGMGTGAGAGAGGAANPHAGMPGMGGGMGAHAMEGTTPGNIPFDPKSVIAGELRLDAKLKDKVKAGDAIFLVARSGDKPTGPILAVKKLTAGDKWPLAFSIDGRDAMMPGTQMAGKVTLSVRVDKDGDAITKNPGDVTGMATTTPPNEKLVVNLDTVL